MNSLKYSITRIINFGTKNFVRNIGLSIVTVAILLMALLSVNTLITVRHLTGASLRLIQDRVEVRIQFYPAADAKLVTEITTLVREIKEVVMIKELSATEVRDEFKERHKNDNDILAALNALRDNPFGAALLVKAHSAKDYETILSRVGDAKYEKVIEQKTFGDHEEFVTRVHSITRRVTQFATGFSIVFVVFAFFIIFNAIRVTVYSQREEIGIMRLVGATKWFIRGPFYLEAFYYTLLAVIASAAIALLMLNVIDPTVQHAFGQGGFSVYSEFKRQLPALIFWEFFGVLSLTIFSASIAMRKYLKI